MKTGIVMAALLIASLALPPVASSCPCSQIPKPLSKAPPLNRQAGLKFMDTDEYRSQFAAAIEGARAACEAHKGEPHRAIVADIDETLLDNRPEFQSHPDFDWNQFTAWIERSCADTLKPTAEFLSWARTNGYAVFLVTGRPESLRRPTIENLVRDGIAYDALYMRGNDDHRPAEEMKGDYRRQIEALGFKIIVSIGDQDSDLYGGHAEDCEKLPNRIYYIP